MKQIALIKTGTTLAEIKPLHGDFEDWFAAGLGVTDLLQVDVFRHHPLPDPERLSAVVITGSPAMVSARESWSEKTAQWLSLAVAKGLPTLGVCYGHQLLAHALGGKAGPNPRGRQISTVSTQAIDMYIKDPLLGHLPTGFLSQTSHSEVVLELPPGAQRLATSPLDDNFSIRFAENAWGVQFHPEFSAPVMRKYIELRSDAIRKEDLNPDALLEKVSDTPEATTVLQKFVELVRGRVQLDSNRASA